MKSKKHRSPKTNSGEGSQPKTPLAQRIVLWTFALIILGLTVMIVANLPQRAPKGPVQNSAEPVALRPTDWVKGAENAKVVLIEYSDFQCPSCAQYHPVLQKLLAEFGDRMQFAYRHFPLRQHSHADEAARAAEAAGKQGKFWEMHDLIFDGQAAWSNLADVQETFVGYARQLGLDLDRFNADMESAEVRKRVEMDRQSGTRQSLEGTPTFFLDGVAIQNPQGYDEFRNIIERAIHQAG